MLEVNNHYITTDIYDILIELRTQLATKGIKRFAKIMRSGDNIQTTCPFHHDGQERKPSFGILTKPKGKDEEGTCHCFACGWSGSFSEMVSNVLGYDDLGVQGSKWLVRNFLIVDIETRPELDLDLTRTVYKDKNGNDYVKKFVSEAELDKYRYYHPYMFKRKMTREVIDIFDVGYDKDTDCITFPVRDINGNCLFVARRNVKKKFFQYPENVVKPVYGLYELYHNGDYVDNFGDRWFPTDIIVCESMIDAITAWVYGKRALALNGTGNDLQFKQLSELPCRCLILATDMDEAGLKARERIKRNVKNKIIKEYIWDINMAKDINDMSKEQFNSLQEYF